jgi:hypothetical protein
MGLYTMKARSNQESPPKRSFSPCLLMYGLARKKAQELLSINFLSLPCLVLQWSRPDWRSHSSKKRCLS